MSDKKQLSSAKSKRQALQGQLERIREFFNQAIVEELDPASADAECAIRAEFEELYFSLQPSLVVAINEKTASTSSQSKDSTFMNTTLGGSTVKLPNLVLPTFSGDYTKWMSYFETFTSLVDHNETLDAVAKFHHLRGFLSGEALRRIQSIEVTPRNYEEAIKMLKERYANNSIIVEEHIKGLLDFPSISRATATNIRELVETVNVHLRSLTSLGRPVAHWDDLIISIVLQKLDSATNERWIDERPTERLPILKELFKFLDKRSQQLERKTTQHQPAAKFSTQTTSARVSKAILPSQPKASLVTANNQKVCTYCISTTHSIYRCRRFLALTPKERFIAANKCNLCINCLKGGHTPQSCESEKCKICRSSHHTLVHDHHSSVATIRNSPNSVSHPLSGEQSTNLSHSTSTQASLATMKPGSDSRQMLLATAIVNILGMHGQLYPARAILDPGSQVHLITEALAQQLGLKRFKSFTPICGVEETSTSARYSIYTKVQSLVTSYTADLCFHILSRISEQMPNFNITTSTWNIPFDIKLADPNFSKSSKIDVLLGAEIFYDLLLQDQIRLGDKCPVLQNTRLGYIIGGSVVPAHAANPTYSCKLTTTPSISSLEKIVRQFWELEAHNTIHTIKTEEVTICEQHFATTVRRSATGRFVVRLPFKYPPTKLGNSLDAAQRRFGSLERKFKRQPDLKQQYVHFMNEYEALQHMHRVQTTPNLNYFLPHHCVIHPESSTTKLRVVFDALAASSTKVSLNDLLMIGPTVQSDLFTIATRFRAYRWVFTTDIKQMYRQIDVDASDRPYQMIVWRANPEEHMACFELNTVTYGTSAAPYLATACLDLLATEEEPNFPLAATSVKKDTYVDNIMTGAHDLQDAVSLLANLVELLRKGQFELRKFCANDPTIIHSIPDEHKEPFLRIGQNDIIKTLGLAWEPTEDVFIFHINISEHKTITKRHVLSDLGKIFDPMGLLGPVIVLGKVFLQELWKLKCSWDQELPPPYQEKWCKYVQQLQLLRDLKVPRHLLSNTYPKIIELHAFSDSSESAYGACCYLRCVDNENNITIRLICSKSRVAPVKSVTLPRLELCAALLMIELIERIQGILPISVNSRYLYCDSRTVLAWIARPSYTWQTFVANRVAKIQELSRVDEWRYINTKDNPADIISRGAWPEVFMQSLLWVNGPDFLSLPYENWPSHQPVEDINDIPDQRHTKSILMTTRYSDLFSSILHRGSWRNLERIIAYCFRFAANSKLKKSERSAGPLTTKELETAHTGILRNIQRREFSTEYKQLLAGKLVDNGSRLKSLSPFLDETGLIRVGGRLQNSCLNYDAKHQILLPKNYVTKMIIVSFHFMHLHAGPQTLLAVVRQWYWPIDGKAQCRNIVHQCVRCFRTKPTRAPPLMGNLPPERVQPGRAFLTTGIDFCGPFRITSKIRGRAPTKAYICVFVCFTTKAIHLEVVSDLSTEAFIAALHRFIARRGLCKTIFCDTATNFVGAKNELAELYKLFQGESHQRGVQDTCQQRRIDWCHIPPRSPHFGGLWEAAVKTAKYHLVRIMASATLTFEELCTVATQVEAVLNSRPITPLSSDPSDMEALTPGHFLIGCPLTSFPEPDISEAPTHRLSRFRRLQQLQQIFWKRWSTEYLHLLQQRHKWIRETSNLEQDTLVVIQDDNTPPYKWVLGRLLSTIPGRDGIPRVAEVRTPNGVFKRAVTKLHPLPLEN